MRLRFHINYRSDTEYSVTTTILGSDSALIFCIVCTYIHTTICAGQSPRGKAHASHAATRTRGVSQLHTPVRGAASDREIRMLRQEGAVELLSCQRKKGH